MKPVVFGLLAVICLAAQYPGGRRGVDLPPAVPGGHKAGRQPGQQNPPGEPLASFSGTVKRLSSNKLTLEGADSNVVEFYCTKKTRYYQGSKKIKGSAVKPGDRVSVEAIHGLDGALEAVNVGKS